MGEWFGTFWAVYSNLVLTIGINALLALSIWLTLSCGLLAMANAAFMGLGAYTASLLTMNFGAPFPLAVLGGIAVPTVIALLVGLPTLRLSGVYLAMATLGFGEVVRVFLLNADSITGGALGLSGIPQLTQWWHVLLALVVVLLVLWRMRRSQHRPRLRGDQGRRDRRFADGHRRDGAQDARLRARRCHRRPGRRAQRAPHLLHRPERIRLRPRRRHPDDDDPRRHRRPDRAGARRDRDHAPARAAARPSATTAR